MRVLVALPLLAGCDILFQLREVKASDASAAEASIDAPARCVFSDNFDDNMLSSQWTLLDPTHAGALVSEQASLLDIALEPNTVGYNGVVSSAYYNATGKSLQAVVFPMNEIGFCEAYMRLEVDSQNRLFMQTGAGNITFGIRVAGADDSQQALYDGSRHLHWQIRHDPVAGIAVFEVSPDGDKWTVARTVLVPFSLDAAQVSFIAGTYQVGLADPGSARFDNAALCSPE